MLAHEPLRLPPHMEDEFTDMEGMLNEVQARHLARLYGMALAQQRELEQARHELALVEAGRMVQR